MTEDQRKNLERIALKQTFIRDIANGKYDAEAAPPEPKQSPHEIWMNSPIHTITERQLSIMLSVVKEKEAWTKWNYDKFVINSHNHVKFMEFRKLLKQLTELNENDFSVSLYRALTKHDDDKLAIARDMLSIKDKPVAKPWEEHMIAGQVPPKVVATAMYEVAMRHDRDDVPLEKRSFILWDQKTGLCSGVLFTTPEDKFPLNPCTLTIDGIAVNFWTREAGYITNGLTTYNAYTINRVELPRQMDNVVLIPGSDGLTSSNFVIQ